MVPTPDRPGVPNDPVTSGGMDRDGTAPDEVERRLDELEAQSKARREELRDLIAQLPAATSRRAYLRAMVTGFASAPDKPTVARRVVVKILRTPADLVRRLRR